MVPGTALGVLVGDLAYTWLAVRLMRREGRDDVTAMPFGIDTPTLFAMVFGVLAPVHAITGSAETAWKVGMATTVAIGIAKTALAFAGDWTRRVVPRAALLGSIAGVAILLIAFLPALKIVREPLVGLVALGLLLLALVGGVRMPFGIPGAFAAVAVGAAIFWLQVGIGLSERPPGLASAGLRLALPWPTLAWTEALADVLPYLSLVLPFALVTTIGGIDNTESAAVAGDEYRTRDILLIEAMATILAGVAGGVVQNTPYIGHPAYKAMGARAAYTLATGLVIGVGAMLGVISILVDVVPEAAVAPILVFIGLEITAQAFLATPARHAPAVALALIPTIAALVLIQLGSILGSLGIAPGALRGEAAATVETLRLLGNGFILTALLWGAATALIIDRRLLAAAATLGVASLASLSGVIHSPLESGGLFWPGSAASAWPGLLAGSYGLLAALLVLLAPWTAPGPDLEAGETGGRA
jgi:AGZA family xanthine/uracil permease-like MFS transporter